MQSKAILVHFWLDTSKRIRVRGIPVLHDSIGGSGWDLISGGKRVGLLHGLKWKFEAWTEVKLMCFSIL